MKPHSIRNRILFLLIGAQLLLAAATIVAISFYARLERRHAFDADLQSSMTRLVAQIHPDEEMPTGLEFNEKFFGAPSGDLFLIRKVNGLQIAGSSQWDVRLAPLTTTTGWEFWQKGHHYRGATWANVPLSDDDEPDNQKLPARINVFYARPTTVIDSSFRKTLIVSSAAALSFLLLSTMTALWAISRGVTPLNQLAERAGQIGPGCWQFDNPQEILQVEELRPLATALSSLLARLQTAFHRERTFFHDAAHELKTAVAIQKSTLQLLEQDGLSNGEYKTGIDSALEDTARTEDLIAKMLELARAEHSTLLPSSAQSHSELGESLIPAISHLRKFAETKEIEIVCSGARDVDVVGNPGDLLTVWKNLLENAVRHSNPASVIEVNSVVCAKTVDIAVRDYGEGISEADLPHLFDRFYRGDPSRSRRSGGFGLGLAITKSLVENFGGSIEIASVIGQGTRVRVRLKRRS